MFSWQTLGHMCVFTAWLWAERTRAIESEQELGKAVHLVAQQVCRQDYVDELKIFMQVYLLVLLAGTALRWIFSELREEVIGVVSSLGILVVNVIVCFALRWRHPKDVLQVTYAFHLMGIVLYLLSFLTRLHSWRMGLLFHRRLHLLLPAWHWSPSRAAPSG